MADFTHAAPACIFSFTDEGLMVQVNDALCRLLKWERQDICGQKVNKIFTISTLIFYQTHFFPLLKMQQSVDELYITLKTADKEEVPVLMSARRISENGTTENVCACLPIYHRKQYEDEILAAKKQAETSLQENTELIRVKTELQQHIEALDEQVYLLQQRNEELKQFNTIITHDLQEPLRKLHLFTDILINKKEATPAAPVLHKIIHLSRQIRGLLYGLQNYVRLDDEPLHISGVDLNKVLLIARQKVMAEYPGVHFTVDVNGLENIEGDFDELVLLFYHLLSNSLKFRSTHRKPEIVIEGTQLQYNQFKTSADHYKYTDHLQIRYSDNGIGFDPQYGQQIFRLLKKLDNETEGSGIGLTICKKIIANHKGTITATSVKDAGATFIIYLPLRQQ